MCPERCYKDKCDIFSWQKFVNVSRKQENDNWRFVREFVILCTILTSLWQLSIIGRFQCGQYVWIGIVSAHLKDGILDTMKVHHYMQPAKTIPHSTRRYNLKPVLFNVLTFEWNWRFFSPIPTLETHAKYIIQHTNF